MNVSQQKQWARIGATARLRELDAEGAVIRKAFPDLRGGRRKPRAVAARKRRKMSAAGRAAIIAAAKKRWAEWRKNKA